MAGGTEMGFGPISHADPGWVMPGHTPQRHKDHRDALGTLAA
jgi:hypothetical protein